MARKVKPFKIELIRMTHQGIPLGVKDIAELTRMSEKTIREIVSWRKTGQK